MDSFAASSDVEDSLLDRMIDFIAEHQEDLKSDLESEEFWKDFPLTEGEKWTADDLRQIFCDRLLNSVDEKDPLCRFNLVQFLNWKYCQKYKKSLEFDPMHHIIFSWIVSTPDEISNDVLLSLSEIGNRLEEFKDEYDVTGVLPDCLQPDYLQAILDRVVERYNLEQRLVAEFKNLLAQKFF